MAEKNDTISVEIPTDNGEETPVVVEPETHVEVPVTVETPAPETNGGDSVEAVAITELMALRERMTQVENENADLRSQLANVQATAEGTAEVVSLQAEADNEEITSLNEVVDEIQQEMQPPDIKPNNSHPWFRTRDEWKSR